MPNITQTVPAPAKTGTPEATALRKIQNWREKDRQHLADKRDRDAQRAEYAARNELRGAADNLDAKAGQP